MYIILLIYYSNTLLLVGGWTNPIEKNKDSQIGSFPQIAMKIFKRNETTT